MHLGTPYRKYDAFMGETISSQFAVSFVSYVKRFQKKCVYYLSDDLRREIWATNSQAGSYELFLPIYLHMYSNQASNYIPPTISTTPYSCTV